MAQEKNKQPEFIEKAAERMEKISDKEVEELIEKVIEEL
jgi:hypothetical protein